METNNLIKLVNVSKFYYNKGKVSSGISKVNLTFNIGEFVAITGESGSGKTTLLNVLSGLDSYEEGEMLINGEETSHYNENDFEKYRKTYIGNIFQSFNLVNSYTVYQNIELVLLLNGYKEKEIKTKILDLIKKVDLEKYKNTKVSKLSGGQKQRVAIARVLAKETPIIICDEPTGNLDSKSAKSVLKLLKELSEDKLVIVVTHNYEQVEEYVTRKIEMFDGKVREDISLKKIKPVENKEYYFKDIKPISLLKLGIRNNFNIPTKCLLLFLVFIFVICSFLSDYSSFRTDTLEQFQIGYNYYFGNIDDKRIVVNKKDKSMFTDEDISYLSSINNVSKVVDNDLFLDSSYSLSNDQYDFYGNIYDVSEIESVTLGRLPEKDNEVVIKYTMYDNISESNFSDIQNLQFTLYDSNYSEIEKKFIIVGAIKDSVESLLTFSNTNIYVSSNVISKVKRTIQSNYSTTNVKIANNNLSVSNAEIAIFKTNKLKSGEAIISDNYNYYYDDFTAKNKTVWINIENIYYSNEKSFKVVNTYNNDNVSKYGKLQYEDQNVIFISEEDFINLYSYDTYQVSLFANDIRKVDSITSSLDEKYDFIAIKDAIENPLKDVLEIINILKLIYLIGSIVVMFFIAYFVIRLIQKSKNIYYATVRILGGSVKTLNSLIRIELLTNFSLTYLIFLTMVFIYQKSSASIYVIDMILKGLYLYDYIIIFIILFVISLLIANRYSKKLFKSSAMKTYVQEV